MNDGENSCYTTVHMSAMQNQVSPLYLSLCAWFATSNKATSNSKPTNTKAVSYAKRFNDLHHASAARQQQQQHSKTTTYSILTIDVLLAVEQR
jgi:hypothetical protein